MDALAEGTAPKDEIIARLNEEKQRKTVRATELTKLSKLASIGSPLCSRWPGAGLPERADQRRGRQGGKGPQGELACSCLRFTRCRSRRSSGRSFNEPAA